jgi:hypothetical protein
LVGPEARRTGLEERSGGGASHARQGTGLGCCACQRGIVAIAGIPLCDVGKGGGFSPGRPSPLGHHGGRGLERRVRRRSPRKNGPSPLQWLALLLLQLLVLMLCLGWLFRSVFWGSVVVVGRVASIVVFQKICTRHRLEEMPIEREMEGGRQNMRRGNRGSSIVIEG